MNLLTFECGACGTKVTGLLSYTYVLKVMDAHAKVCLGHPPQRDSRSHSGSEGPPP